MSVGRAFLSHSTKDKPFVEAVAKRLGRQQVRFDKWVFEVGQDLLEAIENALNNSGTFVLFASKASIASTWVKLEVALAHKLVKADAMKTALVFIIDPEVRPSDLPKWMQRALIRQVSSSNAVARAIQYHLNSLRGLEKTELFLGRNMLLEAFSEKLFPSSGQRPPHVLIVSGLEGVGRRTFISHAVRNALSIQPGPVLHLRRTDGIDALHLALVTELNLVSNIEELNEEVRKFRSQTSVGKAETIADLLHRVAEDNVVPCILDDGALLESNAQYKPEAIALFDSLKRYPETVVALIHTHKPRMTDAQFASYGACYEKIPALDATSTKQLVMKRLSLAKIDFIPEQIENLAPYLGGYPPAASLAVGLARDYGLQVLLADKSMLVNFQIQTFGEVLERLKLSDEQWSILRVLAAGLEMPLESLASAVRMREDVLAPWLRHLVDLNLVLVSNSVFSIAYPIRFAVQANKGTLSPEEFNAIGRSLKEIFWDGNDSLPPYEVIESTISAVLRSDAPELQSFGDLVLPSLLFRAAKESYEQWGHLNWEKALGLLRRLLSLDPKHRGALVLMLKIQVKRGQWSDAEQTLKQIQDQKLPERFALEGYFNWKQKRFSRAVGLYKLALSNGERAVEIYHGLANCLFQMGNVKEATRYIDEGLKNRARHNGLLIDLAAKMAIVAQDFESAGNYVEQLRRLNATTDYHHRAATLFAAMKKPAEALPHARAALNGARGRYEIDCVLISILIDLRQFQEAEERLRNLEANDGAGGSRKDVRLGLRLKLLLRLGDWRGAEKVWDLLSEKTSPVHLALRMELLNRKAIDKAISPEARSAALEELKLLGADLPLEALFLDADYDPESYTSGEDLEEESGE